MDSVNTNMEYMIIKTNKLTEITYKNVVNNSVFMAFYKDIVNMWMHLNFMDSVNTNMDSVNTNMDSVNTNMDSVNTKTPFHPFVALSYKVLIVIIDIYSLLLLNCGNVNNFFILTGKEKDSAVLRKKKGLYKINNNINYLSKKLKIQYEGKIWKN